jgi:uncharacterized protein (TIGR03435 family)
MTKTKTIVLVSLVVLVLGGAAVAVKMIFFPSLDDKFFQINSARLRQAPPGRVVVRPTHFPDSPKKSSPPGYMQTTVKGALWMVGRNLTFQQLFATAYSYNPGRIALPPNPPKGNFDFLVTVPKDPEVRLQAAIKRKLGYTAQKETRDTDVLALKVADPNSPGLKVSTAARADISPRNGRLYLTHLQMSTLANLLEQVFKMPVVDKTALTNFYDFSLVWDAQTQQQVESGTIDHETGRKILAEWGLGLEPDTASLEMLVVKKAN